MDLCEIESLDSNTKEEANDATTIAGEDRELPSIKSESDKVNENSKTSPEIEKESETLDTKGCVENDKSTDDHVEGTQNILNSNQDISDGSLDKQKSLNFKTPALLIGPRKGKPGKLRTFSATTYAVVEDSKHLPKTSEPATGSEVDSANETESVESSESELNKPSLSCEIPKEKQIVLPYKEPVWGGLPEKKYKLEVLKSGVILDSVDLTLKSVHVFGRLPVCDIPLAHPTISRYHAVIQYRLKGDEQNPQGLYLYDLGSTHGSFWNGHRIKSNVYVRIRSGHMIRFGCSQRKFIVHGPTEDEEEENEMTVTELKEHRRLELAERERKEREEKLRREEEERLRKEKEENEGIDWGMGEDADEETDLSENPYAATNNEELFLDDPKKTLRGWFEREGFDLQYQTEEKGIGQFLCWVELPIDNVTGKSVRAEALVKGKKKESVIQCALEACRILDRHGVLRQAHHEGRKRKAKNWEEEDFYDSDEDNFLDRTGAIEKKRLQRMRVAGKLEDTVETYASLLEKHKAVVKQITNIEKDLQSSQKRKDAEIETSDEDALDAFMSNLKSALPNKSEIVKMKLELQTLRKEEMRLINLVNIAKPANLPPLKPQKIAESIDKEDKQGAKSLPLIGNRKKFKPLRNVAKSSASLPNIVDEEDKAVNESDKSDDEKEVINTRLMEAYKSNLIECDRLNDGEVTETRDRSQGKDIVKDSDKNSEEAYNESDGPSAKLSTKEEQIKEAIELQKRKKKNQKRIQQRLEKAEKDKLKGYEEDTFKDDYSMWVPPQNQTGDGKTNLNDKFGY